MRAIIDFSQFPRIIYYMESVWLGESLVAPTELVRKGLWHFPFFIFDNVISYIPFVF